MRVSPLEEWIKNSAFLVEACQQNLEKYQLKELKSTLTYAKKRVSSTVDCCSQRI